MFKKLRIGILAARELGFKRVGQYILYQLGLISGYYRWRTPARPFPAESAPAIRLDLLPLPSREELQLLLVDRLEEVVHEADEIVGGKVRLFGGDPVELQLAPPGKLMHWSRRQRLQGDIKLIWEPARFGWVFALGRAYLLTGDERFPAAFWQRWEEFQRANPVNLSANWESAQEVSLRLIALCWAARLFESSPHSSVERKARLAASLVDHARRIPPTLIYARAQDNNHLISEAAGLYTAGVLLTRFPQAKRWKKLGWLWFNRAVQSQIEDDGEYIQHSTNYQRMVLQLALFVELLARRAGEYLPSSSLERLGAATRWLLAHFDSISGRAANLGHNDGANPLPLAMAEYADYRPLIQAASLVFLGRPALPAGAWDEYVQWLGLTAGAPVTKSRVNIPWRIERLDEWASLRGRRYASRPAHADQLHVDLWYKGRNILLDAGSYAYNAAPPWDNGLMIAGVHNSLTVDGQDPMQRAGRFLWLRWVQAQWDAAGTIPGERLMAYHDGFARLGWRCQRILQWLAPGEWRVTDELIPLISHTGKQQAVLHWLLPDGDWQLEQSKLTLQLRDTRLTISIDCQSEGASGVWNRIVRAGQALAGPLGEVERLGWYSPTYMSRVPALSFQTGLEFIHAITICSNIKLISIS